MAKLDLPHDWSIFNDFDHQSPAQNEGGQLNGGGSLVSQDLQTRWKDLQENVRVTFDGVYMDSQVYVNGQLVGIIQMVTTNFIRYHQILLHKDGRENVWLLSMWLTNNQVAVGTQVVVSTVMWPYKDR